MNRKSGDKYLEKRQEIMEAALDCFHKQGFMATTIKMIATAAGMKSTALIYYYFKDKDDLYRACLTESDIPPMQELPLDTEPEEFFFRIQSGFMDMINDRKIRKLLICSSSAIEMRPDLISLVNEKYRQPYKKKFMEYVEYQKKQGIFRDIDPWQLYLDIFTPLFMRCIIVREWLEWNRPEKRLEYEKVLLQRTKNILRGIIAKE